MGDRVRAAEESTEEKPAAPVIVRPEPAVSNRQSAELLTGPAPGAARLDDISGLGGAAGNRAMAQWLGNGPATPGAAPAPAPAPAPAVAAVPAVPPIAWIDTLDDEVQRQIDSFNPGNEAELKKGADQRLTDLSQAHRVKFMETMKGLMGSYAAVEAHFKDVKPMGNSVKWPLRAHVSTRERLLEVQEDLKGQDVPMPQTDVGLGMRGDHLHPEGKGPGWFTHAAGFAVDWRAYRAPKISDPNMIALFDTVTGGPPHMRTSVEGNARVELEIKMGQGTADAAESQRLLDSIETEYKRLAEGSEKFKTDLPATTLARLRAVELARIAIPPAEAQAAAVKKDPKSTKPQIDAAELAAATAVLNFRKLRDAVIADLPKLFEPWTKKLDERIAVIDGHAAAAGVDLGELTGRAGFAERTQHADSLTAARRRITQQATQDAAAGVRVHHDSLLVQARVGAARAGLAAAAKQPPEADQWTAELGRIEQDNNRILFYLFQARLWLGGIVPTAELEAKPVPPPKPAPVTAQSISSLRNDTDRLLPRVAAVGGHANMVTAEEFAKAGTELTATTNDIQERRDYRQQKITELGGGTDRRAQAQGTAKVEALLDEKVKWLALKAAKNGLISNANDFVLRAEPDTLNPALTQLLGLKPGTGPGGVFTPDPAAGGEQEARTGQWSDAHGYNLAFIKSMVSHGFELGVAWKGGSDPMHFELAEGRKFLESHGTEALVAGADLRAQEEAEEAARQNWGP